MLCYLAVRTGLFFYMTTVKIDCGLGVPTNISAGMKGWDQTGYELCAYVSFRPRIRCLRASANVDRPVHAVHTDFTREDLPHGCIGPEDIAKSILFLASDESKMISGVLLPVDNAWSAT